MAQTTPAPALSAAGPGQSIADPGPLGLAGFAGTTFFLSVVNTNMLGASVQTVVLGLALFYGGIAQLLAGMWEFVKGNTFGAVAFTSFGAFWMSFWYLLNHLPASAKPNDLLHGVGVYLMVWAIFTAYMTVAATKTSGAILSVFVFLTLAFVALAAGFLVETPGRIREEQQLLDPPRRLARADHGSAGVVRVVRRSHQLDVQANRPAHVPALTSWDVETRYL